VYSSFRCYSLFIHPSNLWSNWSHAPDSYIFGFVVLQMCARRLRFPFSVCSSTVLFIACLFRLCFIYITAFWLLVNIYDELLVLCVFVFPFLFLSFFSMIIYCGIVHWSMVGLRIVFCAVMLLFC
jgi:hypothetical protein